MNWIKREQREIYRQLVAEVDYNLCMFCNFNYPDSQGESPCDSGDSSCHHPLKWRLPEIDEPAVDCWGFKPSHDISFCADIIGHILANGWHSVFWWLNKKDIWIVWGSSEI